MSESEVKYTNLVLSSSPCPRCIEAADLEPMTADEWRDSEYGLPGSDGRFCSENCHCLLVPNDIDVSDIEPLFGKEKLRGEEDTDIRKVVEFGSAELELKELMDLWNARHGKLPAEIYKLPVGKVADYLKALLAQMES